VAPGIGAPRDGGGLEEVQARDEEREVPEDRLARAGRPPVGPVNREAEEELSGTRPPRVPEEEQEDEEGLGRPEDARQAGRGLRGEEDDDEDQDRGDEERAPRQADQVEPEGGRPQPEPLGRDGGKGLFPARLVGWADVADHLRLLLSRPKAELHLHLEGAVRPGTLVRLAARAGSAVFPDLAAVRARRRFEGLAGFLALYRDVCRLLRGPADFALLARDLTARLRRERIVYAEAYVSPAIVERLGFDWASVRDAVEAVFAAHERAGYGRIRVLLDAVRHFGPDAAHRVLDAHARHPWPRAVGFGLGGDELALPARDFASVYRRLPGLGLAPVVHAGEAGGPDSVAEALRWLKPRRIAHGVAAASDAPLVRRLARSGVALDVCLTSNAATGAFPLSRHPVLSLLRAGVTVTLGTDDPGLFGATLSGEYRKLARLGATRRELLAVSRAGFRAALAPSRHQPPASPTTRS